jgi:RNA polymerase sigma-70 factor (ECF subfamily)
MASGDTDAATAFVRRYQARVYGLAYSIVGSSAIAEEVAQEAFLRVWRHAAAYDARRSQATTWLLTITRNLAIDTIRLRREQPIDPHTLVGSLTERDGRSPGLGFEDSELLRAALRQLPIEQSTSIVLSVFYGLTAKEVAERESIPLGTAKTRIRRGLARLRDIMGVNDG